MIQLKQLSVLKNEKVILKDINLTINQGDKILLKGESGSGKSTLIKSLLVFETFQGFLLFNGKTVSKRNLCYYRRQCGYISQTLPHFNEKVSDFLNIPYLFKANRILSLNTQKMRELLNKLNFNEEVLEKNFSELSGGEKQRMVILQMLLLDKPIYLLDEVTSALDKKNIGAVISLITQDKEKTIISISHNQEWEDYCARVIELDIGGIIHDTLKGEK